MTTYMAKPAEVTRSWFVVDAAGLTLGRLATRIAMVLRGKHKPTFTPHVDTGDYVIVVNASQVTLSGNKLDRKRYYRYSGYPGGLHATVARDLREHNPDRMIREAVKGMLPKNRLATTMIDKLKVYGGADHPHAAQNPTALPEVF